METVRIGDLKILEMKEEKPLGKPRRPPGKQLSNHDAESPEALPGADLTAFPVNSLARWLDLWASSILNHCFSGESKPSYDARLLLMLRPFMIRRAMKGGRYRGARKALYGSLEIGKKSLAGSTLTPLSFTIGDALNPALLWRWARSWGNYIHPYPSPELWNLVAHRAWSNAEFRRAAALRVRAYLSHRHLFHPNDTPVLVRLHPNTFWLLTAALLPAPSTSRWRPFRRRRLLLAWRFLRVTSGEMLQTAEWAGFWDQWLIAEVLSQLRPDLTESLKQIVSTLPILESAEYQFLRRYCAGPRGQLEVTRADWREQMPLFMTWRWSKS